MFSQGPDPELQHDPENLVWVNNNKQTCKLKIVVEKEEKQEQTIWTYTNENNGGLPPNDIVLREFFAIAEAESLKEDNLSASVILFKKNTGGSKERLTIGKFEDGKIVLYCRPPWRSK